MDVFWAMMILLGVTEAIQTKNHKEAARNSI
jgi:hypothetical protein